MRIIRCKSCGCSELAVSMSVNPNDQGSIQNLSSREDLTEHDVWCSRCEDDCEIEIVNAGDIRAHETDQFEDWQQGRADMFIVSTKWFNRAANSLTAFSYEIFYAGYRAEAWIEQYISNSNLSSEEKHVFEIFYFSPIVERRPEVYRKEEDIIQIFKSVKPGSILNPIYSKTV